MSYDTKALIVIALAVLSLGAVFGYRSHQFDNACRAAGGQPIHTRMQDYCVRGMVKLP
jgi:hypothetical protein